MLQSTTVRPLAQPRRLGGASEQLARTPIARPAPRQHREPAPPSPRERRLLLLWARGYTDQRAARELDVSLRTVRRMSASLMERFGVHSRFQVGGLAHQRGWISLDDLL